MTEDTSSETVVPNPIYVKKLLDYVESATVSLNEITRVINSQDVKNINTQSIQQIRRGLFEAHEKSLPLLEWAKNNHNLRRFEIPSSEANEALLMFKNLNVIVRKHGKNYENIRNSKLNQSFDFIYDLTDEFRSVYSCLDRSLNMILRMKNDN